MKDLKERTLRGGFAKVCAQGVTFVLRVGSLMALARLLEPKDFGLVGMATVVMGVLGLFKDAGLSMPTIQSATITGEEVSKLFWINVLVGAILWLLSVGLAPILAAFYQEPRLFWVTVALAAGLLFNAAGVQHSAILQRQMCFSTLATIEIISSIVSIAVGIGLAVGGLGYWSLVGAAVMLPAASTVSLWMTTNWVPGAPSRRVRVGSMIRFGGLATVNGLVVYIAFNLEKLLLGRFWGAEALGIYGRAYQLVNIPTENLTWASGGVAFSALSRLQEDPIRFKNYFLKGYALLLGLTLPMTVACALFADDLVDVLLGPKWHDAAPLLRLLAPTIVAFALLNPLGWLLYSLGLVARSLKVGLVIAPLMIVAFVLGLPYGPSGVAFSYSAAMILGVVPIIAWCIHGTMISLQELLKTAVRPLVAAMVCGAIAFVVQSLYGHSLSPFPRLVLGGGILLLSYLWMLLYVMGQKAFYLDLLQNLRWRSSVAEERSVAI